MAIEREKTIKNTITGLLILLLILSGAFVVNALAEGNFKSVEAFREYLTGFGAMGPLVLTMIQALQVVLPVLPGFLGCIVGSMLFGVAGSFWINYIGICIGSIAAYWLAKLYGVKLVKQMITLEKYDKLTDWVNKRKSYSLILFLAILLPLAPDDFFCYFSGLTGMNSKRFTWIILLGKPWCILFYSYFFTYLLY